MIKKANMTFEMDDSEIINFENWFRDNYKVISFRILPDTENLYETNDSFKKLVSNVKKAQELRDEYINKHG